METLMRVDFNTGIFSLLPVFASYFGPILFFIIILRK